jgi:hypothetical protein
MALSQGTAGGLPGMELLAWGRMSATGVLTKGAGVVSASLSGSTYQLVLEKSVGATGVVTVAYMGLVATHNIGASGVNISISPFSTGNNPTQTDFYFEVYA